MELRTLATFPKGIVDQMLHAANSSQEAGDTPLDTFNGLPTLVVFRPTADYPGSLHYMFFPPNAQQQFHYHPGERYLLLLGDVDLTIQHSTATITENPNDASTTTVLPACTAAAIRLKKETWHRFSTNGTGIGVIAFTFHPDDGPESRDRALRGLMEELTVFWQEPARDT